MAYSYLFTAKAKKEIKKLPSSIQKRLAQKLLFIQTDPLKFSRKLVSSKLGTYRYRVGNYRVIFDLDQQKKLIIVLKVHHRKDVYKIK